MENPSAGPPKRRAKILIVDDMEDIRQLMRLSLSALGHEILEARDGQEAVKLARQKKPDVIIMDCMMPVLDGWQAARLIRSASETRHIPIIMCTSKDGMEDVEKSLQAGATDYITKPLNLDRLVKNVERALQGFRLDQ